MKKYRERKDEIRRRLKELNKINVDDLFVELCFCICTPLSKAEKVYEKVNERNKSFLLNASYPDLVSFLKGSCRFHRNKARYILEARKKMELLKNIPKDPKEAREYLVKNIKGLGYKEASHFLRNIGYRGLAILDRHIINSLYELGAIKSKDIPKSRKKYLELEEKMKEFSRKIGIDMDELDLLLWSMKTGKEKVCRQD
jgi:N-glycosylase/DNA lyase